MQISHRYSNSAAMINAAFNFNLDSAGKTIKEARVVYGLPGAPAHCRVETFVRDPRAGEGNAALLRVACPFAVRLLQIW